MDNFGLVLVAMGLAGLLLRRHITHIAICASLFFWGLIHLLFGLTWLVILMVIAVVLLMLLFGVFAIFSYRHNATINLDELRRLRG